MAAKKHIGFIFSYNEEWVAGSYYILNIIHALNTLKDDEKPTISILSPWEKNYEIVKKGTNYPYLFYSRFPKKESIWTRGVNKISRTFLKKNILFPKTKLKNIDFIYPNFSDKIKNTDIKKTYWIPDFQEEFLPQFFTEEAIIERKKYQREIVCNGDFVVLSSEDAKNHFIKLYPHAKAKPFVLHFAVTHPNFSNQNIVTIKDKYKLPNNYFFAPNQFWAHKNHKLILEAVKTLKNQGEEIVVAFSGKEKDIRNESYVNELKKFIIDNDLEGNIKFLGFMERSEQLCILKNSIAVIQPSLFEGWSTVVEDAKAIGKYLILSNLEVHKEQIEDGVVFFDPYDSASLSGILKSISLEHPKNSSNDYEKNVNSFGKNFLKLVNKK